MSSRERVIHGYVHQGRIGVLVELGAESDFATGSVEFEAFAHGVALHVAAMDPPSIPDLLEQPFVKDESLTVGQLLRNVAAGLREQVAILRFVRWDLDSRPAPDEEPPKSPAVARRA